MCKEIALVGVLTTVGLLASSGCSVDTVSMRTYGSYPPNYVSAVTLLTTESPLCDLEKVAEIEARNVDATTATGEAIRVARDAGAEFVRVVNEKQNGPKDLTVFALGYRCKR